MWAPVTGEISRIVNSALWSCEGRPVTHDLVAALVSIIEFRIQDSDAIWANRNHHGASLRFIIPLAPGFDVVCEPFKVHPTANTPATYSDPTSDTRTETT